MPTKSEIMEWRIRRLGTVQAQLAARRKMLEVKTAKGRPENDIRNVKRAIENSEREVKYLKRLLLPWLHTNTTR